ncbi:DUF7553 family protein [Natronocalculus amylovorans]|uniref:Uncharacterized protein n=1 Tax=Natronocalculus amylovorans TaxID=2917812 RepID=A0AAE3FW32_9EURY|nr:hypothetical protein [Natronocalculus amylovorans]MCL9816301.1 hypothetical protein [Natronocalculus amylovorans]NUE03391.1 hypothetical protein [Halorubraceae archaeon YAN]
MNKHFKDARYYVGRAAGHLKAGLREELSPIEHRVRGIVGREKEPEKSRLEQIQADLKEIEARAEGEARDAIATARDRIQTYRNNEATDDEQSTERPVA